MTRLPCTYWPRLDRPHEGQPFAPTFDRLAARFRHPVIVETKEELARWAPASFVDHYRRRANVIALGAIVLDYDAGAERSLIREAWGAFRGFAHSTFSSEPSNPRRRVVIVADRAFTAKEHARCMRSAFIRSERLGLLADMAAGDAARAWAVPGCRDAASYEFDLFEGEPFDIDAALAEIPAERPLEPPPPIVVGSASRYAAGALARAVDNVRQAPVGNRSGLLNFEVFCLARLVMSGHLAEDALETALTAAALECGLTKAEARATIRSGLRAGKARAA